MSLFWDPPCWITRLSLTSRGFCSSYSGVKYMVNRVTKTYVGEPNIS